jgi:hypothetical protein
MPETGRQDQASQSTTRRTLVSAQEHSDSAGSSIRRRTLPQAPGNTGHAQSHTKTKQRMPPQISGTERYVSHLTGPRGDKSSGNDSEIDNTGRQVYRDARRVDTGESFTAHVEKTRMRAQRPVTREPQVSSRLGRPRSKSVSSSGEEAEEAQRRRRTRRAPRRERSSSESDESEVGMHGSRRRDVGDLQTSKKEVTIRTGAHPKRESSQGKLSTRRDIKPNTIQWKKLCRNISHAI